MDHMNHGDDRANIRCGHRFEPLEAGAALRRFSRWGLAPVLRIRWTRNHSPIFFYDFDRTRLEFGFTREF